MYMKEHLSYMMWEIIIIIIPHTDNEALKKVIRTVTAKSLHYLIVQLSCCV